MNLSLKQSSSLHAFSLVEVVLALGICSFALVALIGLLGTGLQSGKDSEDQIQATNLASLIISTRAAAPTNNIANFAIPLSALSGSYGDAYPGGTNYIGSNGKLSAATNAAYRITCRAGTNAITGSGISQVYLKLSWPAQMNATNAAAKSYEILTYISIR